jgi:hypothetical protein
MGEACSTHAGRREVYTGFKLGNLKEKTQFESPRRRWEDNIRMDLKEVGYGSIGWTDLAQDRDTCEFGYEPSGSIKCGEFLN